jgi:hypothetical protein
MHPAEPSTPPVEPQPAEKQLWTPPVLKKMDIEETALGNVQNIDLDGAS